MKREGAELGVEFSGHALFSEIANIDDPGSMMVRMLKFIEEKGGITKAFQDIKRWEEANPYKYTEMTPHDFNLPQKGEIYESLEKHFVEQGATISRVDGVKIENPSKGYWAIVRSSNTAASMRVRIGAKNQEHYKQIVSDITKIIDQI